MALPDPERLAQANAAWAMVERELRKRRAYCRRRAREVGSLERRAQWRQREEEVMAFARAYQRQMLIEIGAIEAAPSSSGSKT